jgi:hypothetical protein
MRVNFHRTRIIFTGLHACWFLSNLLLCSEDLNLKNQFIPFHYFTLSIIHNIMYNLKFSLKFQMTQFSIIITTIIKNYIFEKKNASGCCLLINFSM